MKMMMASRYPAKVLVVVVRLVVIPQIIVHVVLLVRSVQIVDLYVPERATTALQLLLLLPVWQIVQRDPLRVDVNFDLAAIVQHHATDHNQGGQGDPILPREVCEEKERATEGGI
uniref:Uncharacterized protein n=1 Tax=Anopheles coluzzii TaxID=1518534 RepID=A0A8W7PFQ7_ANOCL